MTLMIIVMMIGFYIFARHVSHFSPADSHHVKLYRAMTCLLAPLILGIKQNPKYLTRHL